MEQYLREWRKTAVDRHQFETAIFIADKLLAITNSEQDAWWLASIHFNLGNYVRAQSVLSRSHLTSRNPSCKYLAALCYVKQAKYDDALTLLGDKNPVHLITSADDNRRKLQNVSRARNGIGKEPKVFRQERIDRSEDRMLEPMDSIRAEAAMCYLRGLCHAKQNAFDRAKECYKDAVRIDVQCFEAFDALMTNALMSPEEEWSFLESLNFDSIAVGDGSDPSISQKAADFTKLLYITRMSKYSHPAELKNATETLSTHFNLSRNPDILLANASLFFTQCRFRDALALTTSILDADPYNFPALPIQLACLYELSEKNALYLLAHSLADTHPSEPATHLAIGVYYLSINQIASARRFFSKASILDPHFGPAWIGFAHTFAAEGEHDQAISAYSTAARLFQGTHLPSLFLGMQNIQLGNLRLAREYLNSAYQLCQTDPLLLNEVGVVHYHEETLEDAARMFRAALKIAQDVGADPKAWISTRSNLAHTFRRMHRFREALSEFDEVLRLGGKDAGVFSAKGLVLLNMGDNRGALIALHEALAVSPQDPIATDLLSKAMDAAEEEPLLTAEEEDECDRRLEQLSSQIESKARRRRRRHEDGERMILDDETRGEG
ncbi:cell division cycle protein-like protein [Microthyrium microscopicum]|uniref:Cell division cycle protein-like protein n=1 Tax=Microthyrium microscopicum TaxID=703497 RepID=A0A6A6UM90_9PEZI|nr:cell division cycle protein-like protein [Microthyrium microscopicum]